jgi:hypothetical protein
MKQTVEVNGEKREVQAPDQGAKSNSKNEYLVSVSEGVHEVFVLPDGKLSDGNELDGIEIIIPSEREALVARHFSSSGNGSGIAKTAHLVIKASMPGLVKNILVKVARSYENGELHTGTKQRESKGNQDRNRGERGKEPGFNRI